MKINNLNNITKTKYRKYVGQKFHLVWLQCARALKRKTRESQTCQKRNKHLAQFQKCWYDNNWMELHIVSRLSVHICQSVSRGRLDHERVEAETLGYINILLHISFINIFITTQTGTPAYLYPNHQRSSAGHTSRNLPSEPKKIRFHPTNLMFHCPHLPSPHRPRSTR